LVFIVRLILLSNTEGISIIFAFVNILLLPSFLPSSVFSLNELFNKIVWWNPDLGKVCWSVWNYVSHVFVWVSPNLMFILITSSELSSALIVRTIFIFGALIRTEPIRLATSTLTTPLECSDTGTTHNVLLYQDCLSVKSSLPYSPLHLHTVFLPQDWIFLLASLDLLSCIRSLVFFHTDWSAWGNRKHIILNWYLQYSSILCLSSFANRSSSANS